MSCLFCRIVAGEIPASKVYEDDQLIAFNDINPQAPTHVLVIPKRHIVSLAEATPDDAELLGKLTASARTIADLCHLKDGFRVVMNSGVKAGQSVFHLHMHVLGGRAMAWPPG